MPPTIFDFAITGTVPRTDAQIARAKRMAVGGKRKRCTKGKNCSAACIAAHMICMVDLPWVVSSALSQAKGMVQSAGGKAPVAKAAPAPAAKTPQKSNIEEFKKNLKALETTEIQKLLKYKPSPEQKKAIEDELAARVAARAKKPAAAPAAVGGKKVPPNVKVLPVEDYKKMGLVFLKDTALPAAEKYSKDPKIQPILRNMKAAIKQLEQEQLAAAKTPAAKPAAQPAAKPVVKAKPAADKTIQVTANDTPGTVQKKAEKAGLTFDQILAIGDKVAKANGLTTAFELKDKHVPEFATAINSYLKGGALTPEASKTPLLTTPGANRPQTPSPENPHGLSQNQQIIWKKAFGPVTAEGWKEYYNYSSPYVSATKSQLKLDKNFDDLRMVRLLEAAHDNKFTQGVKELYTRTLKPNEVEKLPKPLRDMIAKHGQANVRSFLREVNEYTGNDYDFMRAAMRGTVPREYQKKSDEWKQKQIEEYLPRAKAVQTFLEESKARPAVPKFRAVPASESKLNDLLELSKTGGSFQEMAMNSWSTSPERAMPFSDSKTGAKNRVMFRTMNKSGTSIKTISEINGEQEILTPGGANYKVVGHHTAEVPRYNGSDKLETIHIFDVVEY